ncbi:MAG: HupE/UreJ family protein [Rhodocyclaceae bacterium]|nr:HupE/UreJ family protein [Rhodocyclaceae bacterium]
MRRVAWLLLLLVALFAGRASAHELSMAELEIRETGPGAYVFSWLGGGRVPATDELTPRWPRACRGDENWVACEGPMAGLLRIDGIGKSYSAVLVKFHGRDAALHVYPLTAAQPTARLVDLDNASPFESAAAYANLGIEHILLGFDHLLFVLGLLLIVRDRWMLFKTITAFTLAHSITLAVATFGVARVAAEPLNAAIALSILFLAPEVVRRWRGQTSFTVRHPWIVAFAFGLLHGFGFATGLAELGLAREQIPLALLMFNVGVELGQLGFVLLILVLGRAARRLEFDRSPIALRLPGYLLGSFGAFWTLQRVAILLRGLV